MNSTSSKNPQKKRRTCDIQESTPGPSSEVLPLVAPHLVRKSSKDPNRGMYPYSKRSKEKTNQCSDSSSPDFVKASELRRRRRRIRKKVKKTKSVSVDSAPDNVNSNESLQEKVSSDPTLSSDSTNFFAVTNPKRNIRCHVVKGKRRATFTDVNASNKITRYFKNSNPVRQKNKGMQNILKSTAGSSNPSVDLAETSGWKKKDHKISDALTEMNNEQFFKNYHDCYGLIDNSTAEEGEDYFTNIPTHIIETILCQIPILDLMACRLVCSRWRDVIDDKKFMEWKKMYYKYKKDSRKFYLNLKNPVRRIIISLNYSTVEEGIPTIIKYMGKEFNRLPSSDMYELLMQNAKGELADQVLSERFPEYNEKETRVWCQFALAILISETVWDIFDVYKSLFTSKSACSQPDVIDAMYCVAALLMCYRSLESINTGFHYRLYYALYLIENNIPKFQREKLKIVKGLPGQQSIHSYSKIDDSSSLTYEQVRVLNHKFDMNQKIRIIALAGTGKTTTLLHLSRLYPQIKFLNLVFNRSVNEEAKKKFPKNVTCRTAHSLAFSKVGVFLKHKLVSTIRPYDLIGHLKHNEDHIQIYIYANLVLKTINNFTHSSATEMGLTHVPIHDATYKQISSTNRDRILMDAYTVWQKMTDKDDPFKITHDVYLKLYHLRQPKLHKYQCIMVDEAQDCNPAILDVVLSQNVPVIFVGDPHQQIYGFRGAENALQSFQASHTYHLTKSFRFGPEISYIASCVLEHLLNSRATTIVGSCNDSFTDGTVTGQLAVIARTNVTLFNEAVRMVVFKQRKGNEPTIINAAFAGGINSYGFDQINDIYKLKNFSRGDRQLTDAFISRFKTFTDLVNYANYSEDSDLLSKIDIVNQHGQDTSKFISILKKECNHPMELANVVFSTVHKAKGLEFDSVYLTDDYPITSVPGYYDRETSCEEVNILYVALTRAKKCLVLPEKIMKVLLLAHEKFEHPVSSKNVLQCKISLKCVICDAEFTPHTVLMVVRRKILLGSEREIEGGPLCMKCSSDPLMRPDVHMNGIVMYLDPTKDNSHRFVSSIAGPLPNDPPIVHDRFAEFNNAERVFVINLNIH